ncbi:MAG: hypothetical protein ACTSUR_02870, partial [Candidatus Heimdallarchaeaceae archaeon]
LFGQDVRDRIRNLERKKLVKCEIIDGVKYVQLSPNAYRYLGKYKSFYEHPVAELSRILAKRELIPVHKLKINFGGLGGERSKNR